MATTTIVTLAPANHGVGTLTTTLRAVPANFVSADILINCTTGNPAAPFTGFARAFNDPTLSITFGVSWSWDAGTTFPVATQGTQLGDVTGTWGINRQGNPVMVPDVSLGLPSVLALGGPPTSYRAFATVAGGTITFGVTLNETTT